MTSLKDVCEHCGQRVIRREDGKVLAALPSRLGINRPDAGQLTVAEIARAFHGTGPLIGHIAHICDPSEQQALFEIVGMPQSSRKKRR